MPKRTARYRFLRIRPLFVVAGAGFALLLQNTPAYADTSAGTTTVGDVKCPKGADANCASVVTAEVKTALATLPASKTQYEVSVTVEKTSNRAGEAAADVALLFKDKRSQTLVAVVHGSAQVSGTGKPGELVHVALRRAAATAVRRSQPLFPRPAKKRPVGH